MTSFVTSKSLNIQVLVKAFSSKTQVPFTRTLLSVESFGNVTNEIILHIYMPSISLMADEDQFNPTVEYGSLEPFPRISRYLEGS